MKINVNVISTLYIFLTLISFITELFFYKISFFPESRIFLLGLIALLIVLRIISMNIFPDKFTKINYFLLPIFTISSYFLFFFEDKYGFDYVANQYMVSYSRFFYLTMVSALLALYTASFKISKQFIKKILFLLPVYLILLAFFIYIRNNAFFRIIIQEDHLVEYLQFALLIVCTWLSYKITNYWWQKEKFLGIIFLFAALLCFFVAGEEISWGQRLLGIATPEQIAEINIQGETTIHNIGPIFAYVYRMYMIIGLIGGTSWIFFRLIRHKLTLKYQTILASLIPDWYLSPYFLGAFFYNLDKVYLRHQEWELIEPLWEEPMELLLIIGITFFFIVKFFEVYPNKLNTLRQIQIKFFK